MIKRIKANIPVLLVGAAAGFVIGYFDLPGVVMGLIKPAPKLGP